MFLSLQIATMQIDHNSQEGLQEKPPLYQHPPEAFYQHVQEPFSVWHGLQTWSHAETKQHKYIIKKTKRKETDLYFQFTDHDHSRPPMEPTSHSYQ